jgi:sugar lactone lactonase YvrE
MSLESPRAATKITTISTSQVSELGEGPYFSESEQALYYVDATAGEYVRLDVVIGTETKVQMGSLTSIIIPFAGEPGQFIVTNRNQILKLNWQTKQTTLIAEVTSDRGYERFNDAKCDPQGRLFIGTVLEVPNGGGVIPNGGALYRLDGNTLTKVSEGFSISNGMSWSNDVGHESFYFNDSEDQKIYHFNYSISDGSLSNKRVLIDTATHPDFVTTEYPDGMAIDSYGFIWVAMWNGGRVVKINPDTAKVVDEVRFPRVQIPTSLAFGRYKGEFGFYTTTAAIGLNPPLDSGKIHHVSFVGGRISGFNPSS